MRAVVLTRAQIPHQTTWGSAFAEGLRRHGWAAEIISGVRAPRCDLLVMWGVRNQSAIDQQKDNGGQVCIVERGFVGDRFTYSSVSFGGDLNGRAEFRGPFQDGSRWERHFAHLMQPWATQPTGYALIIGQVPGDMSLAGKDLQPWYEATSFQLHNMGWQVRFWPHPVALQRGQLSPVERAPIIIGSLQEALAGATLVMTWNSNTAVDSVLAGVPTITIDEGSMAWAVSSHSVGAPIVTPDRRAWASRLAWCQFTHEEISSGFCWDSVRLSQTMPTSLDRVYAS